MAGSADLGIDTADASFELERLERDDGHVVVSGWWSGVRGMRFVRPALVVEGRQVLATLEHKPWAAAGDGAWTAAFPWKDGAELDAGAVTLVVAPSVQVPLDREAAGAASTVVVVEPAPVLTSSERGAICEDELLQSRVRELEGVVARERQVAYEAERARDDVVRAHAIAVADRDRAIAQHEEAVLSREAAVRTRARMQAERDEAIAQRDAALAHRDEARAQRDEVVVAQRALQRQLKGTWAQAERAQRPRAQQPAAAARPQAAADPPTEAIAAPAEPGDEQPIGVRVIPAARTVAAHLHRAGREHGHNLTQFDMWVVRILGSVAAVSFIALLVMILKAFFVF
jgi:hypothetical protein